MTKTQFAHNAVDIMSGNLTWVMAKLNKKKAKNQKLVKKLKEDNVQIKALKWQISQLQQTLNGAPSKTLN